MDFTSFQEHLDYLGYISRVEQKDKSAVLFAEASGKPDFSLSKIDGSPFLLIRSNWNIPNLVDDLDKIINSLNEKAVNISSVWHYVTTDQKPLLGISSAYFGDYDKRLFGVFLDVFLADVNRVVTNEDALRFLRSPQAE